MWQILFMILMISVYKSEWATNITEEYVPADLGLWRAAAVSASSFRCIHDECIEISRHGLLTFFHLKKPLKYWTFYRLLMSPMTNYSIIFQFFGYYSNLFPFLNALSLQKQSYLTWMRK